VDIGGGGGGVGELRNGPAEGGSCHDAVSSVGGDSGSVGSPMFEGVHVLVIVDEAREATVKRS
jgi:hypothetical protein